MVDDNLDGDFDDQYETVTLDVVPMDALADSADLPEVGGYDDDDFPNDDVFVSRFPGARATSGRSGTAQFAFAHMYDAGDPHSPGNVGNNRETITAKPSSDAGSPTRVRRVRGVMRYGVFRAGLFVEGVFMPDMDGEADTICAADGTYEYYGDIEDYADTVHIDDDGESDEVQRLPGSMTISTAVTPSPRYPRPSPSTSTVSTT